MQRLQVWALALGLAGMVSPVCGATPAQSIAAIKAVGSEGKGHAAAMAAVKELSQAPASALTEILQGFDGASPLAANWLAGAFEAVAANAVKAGNLPAKELEAYVVNTKNHAGARRLAYEWLLDVDPKVSDRLVPGMLFDPSAEFRRDAVARELAKATVLLEQDDKAAAIKQFRVALSGAVDDDQVKAIVKPLKDLGESVDLQKHFGFLAGWKLIGPFDNTKLSGFDVAYPPERELDFAAKYPGKEGEVSWVEYSTDSEYGVVDLAKALAPHKGAITYAATEFVSARPQNVELRLGTPNAWKLWVNGQLLFARDEYHRGDQLDQYRVTASLKPGKNTILLKVCQNEQTEDWAQKWQYQIRICDPAGAAVLPAGTATTQRESATETRLAGGR